MRRTTLVAVAALLLALAACTDTEPTAITREPVAGTASDGTTTTADGPTTTSEATEPPPAGEDIGPDQPADFATLAAWTPCAGMFECTTLTVPLDWSDPEGETIVLDVTRSTASGDRIGSLLLNPGGPGASGVGFLQGFVPSGVPDGLTERFDIVSWDPRGTGGATRIDCTDDEQWLEPELDPTVEDDADVAAIRERSEEAVAACEQRHGDLLPHVGTWATVRDLDALRGVLGDDGLTYVGYSYGTTIGMEYLRMYPDRVRAMVLDGVSVPGTDPIEDAHVQAQGFERTLDAYLADCPNRSSCPLGGDPQATLLDLVDQLEEEPVEASYQLGSAGSEAREGTLGVGELYIAVAASLYDDESWEILDDGLAEALASNPEGRTLLAIRDQYLGREADGTWVDDADARSTIRCADQVARSEQPEGDLSLADAWAAELPFWGRWFGTGNPGCWGAAPAVDPLRPLESVTGVPPVLVIGTTNDPATPYEQSEDAAEIIEGSVLLTYEGDVHTAFRSLSECVDDAGTAYLIDLTVPEAGIRC